MKNKSLIFVLAALSLAIIPVVAEASPSTIKSGLNTTCAVAGPNSQLYCWGDNSFGQLGNGSTGGIQTTPLLVPGMTGVVDFGISPEDEDVCAITSTSGQIYCWGHNDRGQLADGTTVDKNVPTLVPASTTYKKIAVGVKFVCAIFGTGPAANGYNQICWGDNTYGQMGNGTADGTIHTPELTIGAATVTAVSANRGFACAIMASTHMVYCWGKNDYGQVGRNSTAADFPKMGDNLGNGILGSASSNGTNGPPLAVTTGWGHACAIVQTSINGKKAYCWGNDFNGEVGDNSEGTNRLAPVAVYITNPLNAHFQPDEISAGGDHTCATEYFAIDTNKPRTSCWGWNGYGQLGIGGLLHPDVVHPTPAISGTLVTSVAGGGRYTCALFHYTAGVGAECTGQNDSGQLGIGSTTREGAFTFVTDPGW